ncbi:hypothetical protein SAMN04488498_104315 [Mesorhizobium albiziae]|uniref:Uncharacterized protein n=1 Tax=Neomesorhizobium albiziae TaxID=335020 RepID=A0A1I3YAP2_9HYPH|nr:hypothetical protein [Mesorhizobium albiziae]GLS29980.1 hypothetical protein GCM10007937_16880 [Mesorhizobium albiziae]SFK28928.1 hypothetical protein SAMN04488498_104315 [Mesorhizobium albiziae]
MTFTSPRNPDHYPDRDIDCQVSIDEAFRELWENIAAAGWGPEEIASALYELTDNHLTALRENDVVTRRLTAQGEN